MTSNLNISYPFLSKYCKPASLVSTCSVVFFEGTHELSRWWRLNLMLTLPLLELRRLNHCSTAPKFTAHLEHSTNQGDPSATGCGLNLQPPEQKQTYKRSQFRFRIDWLVVLLNLRAPRRRGLLGFGLSPLHFRNHLLNHLLTQSHTWCLTTKQCFMLVLHG